MTQKSEIPMHGFLWNMMGYTKLHLRGAHFTGGIISMVGTLAAVFATLGITYLPDNLFWRCVAISCCVSLICITIALGSIFTLIFYAGAKYFKLTEETKETAELRAAAGAENNSAR